MTEIFCHEQRERTECIHTIVYHITSEINPILYNVTEQYHPNAQCRIGLISEVIVISIVNPMPLFLSLFLQSYPLFFQKFFVLVQ